MVSDIFLKDYRQYTARGVTFTPQEIVRLNALAVKVKLSQRPYGPAVLPRACFLGKMVFREPTIAHELWLEQVGRFIDIRDARNFYLVHGFALSHLDPKDLPDAFKPEKLIKTVFRFAAKRLVGFTHDQLADAIDYCLYGADWTAGENPVPQPVSGAAGKSGLGDAAFGCLASLGCSPETGGSTASPVLGLILRAKAKRLPISLDEAKRMTCSELIETINRADHADGLIDQKSERHTAMGDYVRTRDEIIAAKKPANATEGQAPEANKTDPKPTNG